MLSSIQSFLTFQDGEEGFSLQILREFSGGGIKRSKNTKKWNKIPLPLYVIEMKICVVMNMWVRALLQPGKKIC